MRSLITYYSFSGNTDKVARIIEDELKKKGEVVLQRLKPKDEPASFIGQCRAAFTKKRAALKGNVNFDASHYDLILVGSPVWAFAPTPAVNAFLDGLTGLAGKRAVIFLTSGSGAGVKKCFENIKTVLGNKGASDVYEVNIQQRNVGDAELVKSSFAKIL